MRQSRAGGSAGSAAGNLNRKGPSALRPFRYRRGVLPLTDVQTLYSRLMTAIACSMTADLSRARPLRPVGEDGSGYSAPALLPGGELFRQSDEPAESSRSLLRAGVGESVIFIHDLPRRGR